MQLTGPLFLFVFLPLSFLPLLLLKQPQRRLALSFLSLLFFIVVNRNHPMGMIHIALLLFFVTVLAYLPIPHSVGGGRLRTVLGVVVPLLSLIAARILGEYFPHFYTYPTGMGIVSLGAVSYAIDNARGDAVRPKNALELIGYLLFFPVLAVGPILRCKQYFDLTEDISLSTERFSEGARLYMMGFVKRIAVGAVLLRAIAEVLSYRAVALPLSAVLCLLLFSYLYFYFFVSGGADMARGVCALYGIALPRDRGNVIFATTPSRMFYGILLSLRNYLLDYLYRPLCRLCGKRMGPLLFALLTFLLTTLFYRTDLRLLVVALPILLFTLLSLLPLRWRSKLRARPLNILCSMASVVLVAPVTLALLMKNPLDVFSMLRDAFSAPSAYPSYFIFGMVKDTRYLLLAAIPMILCLLMGRYASLLRRSSHTTLQRVSAIVGTILLFAAFVLTLIYFMPQFPWLADYVHGSFRL